MSMLFMEGGERGPALARRLRADQRTETFRAVSVALELLHERGQPPVHVRRANEIEPLDAAPRRLGLRKRRPAAFDRLFHQYEQMPGQCAPGRRDDRILLRVDRWCQGVGFDHK